MSGYPACVKQALLGGYPGLPTDAQSGSRHSWAIRARNWTVRDKASPWFTGTHGLHVHTHMFTHVPICLQLTSALTGSALLDLQFKNSSCTADPWSLGEREGEIDQLTWAWVDSLWLGVHCGRNLGENISKAGAEVGWGRFSRKGVEGALRPPLICLLQCSRNVY